MKWAWNCASFLPDLSLQTVAQGESTKEHSSLLELRGPRPEFRASEVGGWNWYGKVGREVGCAEEFQKSSERFLESLAE